MNDETSKLIAKVERFARQEQLFAPAEPGRALHLCAAVSGGADSMALLRVLLELREAFEYPLTACHVNHGLRGETADRDEAFVRAECARLGVPLTVFHPADVGMTVPPHAGGLGPQTPLCLLCPTAGRRDRLHCNGPYCY